MCSGVCASMLSTIDVGRRNFVDPRRTSASAWPVKLVRTQIDHGAGITVVGAIDDDYIFSSGMRARQPQCQFVCLTAAVNQVHDTQRLRQERSQPLAILDQFVMKIASVRIECRHLFSRGAHNKRVAVPNMRNIVDAVETAPAICSIEVLS